MSMTATCCGVHDTFPSGSLSWSALFFSNGKRQNLSMYNNTVWDYLLLLG